MLEQEQQGSNSPQQPGPSLTDRESHDLETQGYTILSLTQLCNTAEAAKAKRKAYKSERQKKAEKRNAFHTRNNKDRIIQAKSFEIEDLCARIEGLKEEIRELRARLSGIEEEHQQEIELMTEMKELKIQMLQVEIDEAKSLVASYKREKKEMKREHAAELEGRDVMQAVLLADLGELVQVYDEEVEALKKTIDRQGKCTRRPFTCFALTSLADYIPAFPPEYSSINNLTPVVTLRDANSATPEHTIANAFSTLRKALASPADSTTTSKFLINIANTLHTSLLTIKQGFITHHWPPSATSASLHATHECVDRVIHFLSLHPDLCNQPPRLPHHYAMLLKNANTLLRRAFSCADTLALELCSLHFSSGGRRVGLMLPSNPLPLPSSANSYMTVEEENNQIDKKDDLLELQYWKRKFEMTRREALEWKEEVGVTVFGDVSAWLEGEIVRLV